MVNAGAHNTVDAQRHVGAALPYLSGMGVDGAHNTVGKMSARTTLLAFCHVREVIGYYHVGVHGTVLSIAVDLSALPYFPCLFPGPYRTGVLDRLDPIGFDCASRGGAVGRGPVFSRSEKRPIVGSGILARPSGRRDRPEVG